MSETTATERADRDAIREHVVSLFDAYLSDDLETLRAGRSEDWKGFQIRSTHLIRGVDDYMIELERVVGGLKVDRYEFVDFEVDIHGEIGIVYYLARDYLSDAHQDDKGSVPRTILIRSIDVYRRVDGSWIQVGSNICAIADPLDEVVLPGTAASKASSSMAKPTDQRRRGAVEPGPSA